MYYGLGGVVLLIIIILIRDRTDLGQWTSRPATIPRAPAP
jgi:hypothetical protein